MNAKCIWNYIIDVIEDQYLLTKRFFISTYQKLRYGASDEECWNLYRTIAKYNLKKLQYFKNMQRMSRPVEMTESDWQKQIDEVIFAFDYILNDEKYNPIPDCGKIKFVNQEEGIIKTVFEKDDACEKLFQEYQNKAQDLENRKRKALVWFAENFETFWD
jgi:hypothetical protein